MLDDTSAKDLFAIPPYLPSVVWGVDVCDGWGCNSHVEAMKKKD